MSGFVKVLMLGTALPVVVSFLLLAAAVCLKARRAMLLFSAAAIGLAYAAAHIGLTGWRGFPPADVTHWLPLIAIAAALVAGVLSPWRAAVAAGAAFVSIGALVLILMPMLKNRWEPAISAAAVAGGALAIGAAYAALAWAGATTLRTPSVAAVLVVTFTGTSLALLRSNSALYGQLAGAVAAAAGPAMAVSFFSRRMTFISAALPCAVLLVLLLVMGAVYSSLPWLPAALLFLSLFAVLLVRIRPLGLNESDSEAQRRPAFMRRVIAVIIPCAVAFVPAAIAVYLAMQASPALEL